MKCSRWTFSQITLFPHSNFSLQQACSSLATSLTRQDRKFTRLPQVNANEEVTTRGTCSKLVASNSLKTIAKTEYADERWIRAPDNSLPHLSP
ncbi:hypothetical protein AVEN_43351-1 [Araneus ventricosus]|uniref:Uncharacterized protein n=1 Tax=Araneus ventricosus TaxID=182803 RepID=A0A4Y2FGZ3_ARAVE|nr:hypothetical protein AVEN_43351-1 [Araneus ventricosus]